MVPAGDLQHEDRVLTVPNLLTGLRLACLPVFVALLAERHGRGRLAAAVLLGALGISDGLDGYIARRFNQVSSLGKVADPAVDRLLVLTATCGGLAVRAIPGWLVGAVLSRELLVGGGGLVLAVAGAPPLAVSRAGKAGTFAMMVALPLFILASSSFRWRAGAARLAWMAAVLGQVCAWGAVAGYFPKALASLRRGAPGHVGSPA